MSSLIFKFFLPILLGYTLFVGLSGRFNPLSKPFELERRPSWLLGNWVGFSVAIVTGIVLHMAYQLPLDAVKTLVKPTGLLLATLVVPGLIAYLVYRRHIQSLMHIQEKMDMSAGEIMDSQIEEMEFDDTVSMEADDEIGDISIVMENESELTSDASETPIYFNETASSDNNGSVSLLFDSVTPPSSDTNSFAENESEVLQDTGTPLTEEMNDEAIELINESDVDATANVHASTDETEVTQNEELAAPTEFTSQSDDNTQTDVNTEATAVTSTNTPAVMQATAVTESDELSASATTNDAVEIKKLKAEIAELKGFLNTESSLRNHTETHLRITRKALKNLEGDSREFESNKADALMNIEGQLDSRIKEVAAAQALASREEAARIEAETTIVNIKQDMLETKRELRRNTEARAKALGTANKTVAFARQSVQARTRAEARIKQLENRLKLSQETVSSLIAALDKEKARTQADVTEMAKELILQQKRINEKRTLDEAGRKTPKRLTRRIAKKVS